MPNLLNDLYDNCSLRPVRMFARELCNVACILCIICSLLEIFVCSIVVVMIEDHDMFEANIRLESPGIGLSLTTNYYYSCTLMTVASTMILSNVINFGMINRKTKYPGGLMRFMWMHLFFFVILLGFLGYLIHLSDFRFMEYPCKYHRSFDAWTSKEKLEVEINVNGCNILNVAVMIMHLMPLFFFVYFSRAFYDNVMEEMADSRRSSVLSLAPRSRRSSPLSRRPAEEPTISIIGVSVRQKGRKSEKSGHKGRVIEYASFTQL